MITLREKSQQYLNNNKNFGYLRLICGTTHFYGNDYFVQGLFEFYLQ